jgi:hypothetical protein
MANLAMADWEDNVKCLELRKRLPQASYAKEQV